MMDITELASVLRESIFSQFEACDIAILHDMFEAVSVGAGQCIRQAGEQADAMFLVVSGSVNVVEPTKHEIYAHLERGDVFGILSLLFPGMAHMEAYAEEAAVLVMMDSRALRMLEISNPKIAVGILYAIRSELAPVVNDVIPVISRLGM